MAARLFVNFVRTQLEQTLLAGGTTLFIDTADAALLPSFTPGDLLRGTLSDGVQTPEIIDVSAVTGGTLTVVRGLESTAAQEWPAGTRLTFGTTAALLSSALNAAQAKFRWTGVATGTNAYTLTVVGALPVPTDGDEITFLIPNTNTGNVTVTVVNGVDPNVGPFSARNTDGAEFGAGSFAAGFYVSLRWVASVGRWIASNLASARLPATALNDGPLSDANVATNGDFEQWNFGTSFNTPASGAVTADSHFPTYDGAIGTFTVSRQSFTLGHTDAGGDPIWFLRWDQTVAGAGSTFRQLRNRLRGRNGVAYRNGDQVTYSVFLKADAARTVNLILQQDFGTGGAPSASVNVASQPCSVTTAWQRFSVTATMTSIAGKTLGSNDDHGINLILDLPLNTTMTIDVAMEQFEPGPRMSEPWSPYPIPLQLGGTGRVASSDASLASQLGPAIFTDLLTRDGAGTGLDADLLHGLSSLDFVRATGSVTQTITGEKNFTGFVTFLGDGVLGTAPRITGIQPTLIYHETDAALNNKFLRIYLGSGNLHIDSLSDALGFVDSVLDINRTGGVTDNMTLFMPLFGDAAGTAGAPSIVPDSADPNTGFYGVSADVLGITVGGVSRAELSTTVFTTTLVLQGPAGSAGTPAYSFSGDPNTGFFNPSADIVGLATNGLHRWNFGATIVAQGDFGFQVGDGSVGSPTMSFVNDGDCGFFRIGANNVGIAGGGVRIAEWDSVQFILADIGPTNVFAAGYRGAPVNTQNAAYGIVLTDAGKTIYHDETSARTWTIPANASVAFPIGTVIVLDNTGNGGGAPGALTIAITSDTLRRGDGVAGTGSRTVPSNGVAIIRKTKATEWSITGIFT